MKRFFQFIQAAIVCGLMVALIFSVPALMAATPIHLDVSFVKFGGVLTDLLKISG